MTNTINYQGCEWEEISVSDAHDDNYSLKEGIIQLYDEEGKHHYYRKVQHRKIGRGIKWIKKK